MRRERDGNRIDLSQDAECRYWSEKFGISRERLRDVATQQGSLPQRRGPKHYRRSDERIREDVCEQLMRSGHIDSSDVDVTVRECTVILDGTVPDRRTKHAIEDLADACLGVLDREQVARVIRRLDRHADRL